MSAEISQSADQGTHWHAGVVEKFGAGVSVVLMGSAFFFPESRVILASASVIVAGIDLSIMRVKSIIAGINQKEVSDRKVREEAYVNSDYNRLLQAHDRLTTYMTSPGVHYKVSDD